MNIFKPASLITTTAAALLATLLAGCAAPSTVPTAVAPAATTTSPTAAPALPELAIEFNGTAFKLPAEVPGGIVAVTVNNTSGKPMDIALSRLRPGKTSDEVLTWLKKTPEDMPSLFNLVSFVFSMNPVEASKPQRVVTDLKTGEFILDATDHVEGATPPDAKHITGVFKANNMIGTVEPKADVTAELQDFAFTMPAEIKAGKQVWKISNTGKQWHMMLIVKPNAGVSAEDILKAMSSSEPPAGPPPFEIMSSGGVAPIGQGERQWVETDLQPGTYIVVCPLPDFMGAAGGPPMSHAEHGMHATLIVK